MGKTGKKKTRAHSAAAAAKSAGWIRLLTLVLSAIILIKAAVFFAAWFGMTQGKPDIASYLGDFHHYREDKAVTRGAKGSLAEGLSGADAQWYASIAVHGYPAREEFSDAGCDEALRLTSRCENYLAWAFFPLWPIILRGLLPLFNDPFLAGFVASNLLSIGAGAVLFLYIRRYYPETIAAAAVALLFASPFALFFQAPFTESLFLFLVACLFLAAAHRSWPLIGVFLALLSVTRPNGIMVAVVPLAYILEEIFRNRRFDWKDVLRWSWCGLAAIPYAAWMAFNHAKTGDWLFFVSVQERWFTGTPGLGNLFSNLALTLQFADLPWHSFHVSRLDVMAMLVSLGLALLGLRRLRPSESAYAAVILMVPLVSKDLMSFSRYALPAWPLFLTLALCSGWPSRRWLTGLLLGLFLLAQLALTIRFVSWQWVA